MAVEWSLADLCVTLTQESGPRVFQFCPSSNFFDCKAMAIGARSQSARTYLERQLKDFADGMLHGAQLEHVAPFILVGDNRQFASILRWAWAWANMEYILVGLARGQGRPWLCGLGWVRWERLPLFPLQRTERR
jgi:hypothetical protein